MGIFLCRFSIMHCPAYHKVFQICTYGTNPVNSILAYLSFCSTVHIEEEGSNAKKLSLTSKSAFVTFKTHY